MLKLDFCIPPLVSIKKKRRIKVAAIGLQVKSIFSSNPLSKEQMEYSCNYT
jgi:hypothetical protein